MLYILSDLRQISPQSISSAAIVGTELYLNFYCTSCAVILGPRISMTEFAARFVRLGYASLKLPMAALRAWVFYKMAGSGSLAPSGQKKASQAAKPCDSRTRMLKTVFE